MIRIELKRGRDGPARHGHPWIFSGAIAAVTGADGGGGEADVVDARGRWLGRGLYQPGASLAVRIYTQTPEVRVDERLLIARIDQALDARDAFMAMDPRTDAWRLVYAEADGLSGLIVDRYAGVLVVRVAAAVLVPFLGAIVAHLRQRTACEALQVVADRDAVARGELAAGALAAFATPLPALLAFRENGFEFEADPVGGQKTGFFLDQRANRERVARYAAGRRVLSVYCYSGAFETYAAAAGAVAVTGIDSSEPALEQARRHLARLAPRVPATYLRADAPTALRTLRDRGETFDLVILDPPCLAPSAAALEKGMRAYKDINLLAMKLLTPGGILASFSCSGQLSPEAFHRLLGWAAGDARRMVRMIEFLAQPPDHPVHPAIPETHYLKGVLCRVDPLEP